MWNSQFHFYASPADCDRVDAIVIKCETLLASALILTEVDDLSNEMLSGLDALYDNIEDIIASLSFGGDSGAHMAIVMPIQGKGHPKLKISQKQLTFLFDAKFTLWYHPYWDA